jgi:hypothetical protein
VARISQKTFNKTNDALRADLNHFIEKYNKLAIVTMSLYKDVEELKQNGKQTKSKITGINEAS